MAKKAKAKKKVAATKKAPAAKRATLDEAMVINVKGEHNRREGSRYHDQYEKMKKVKTVGAFLKGGGDRDVLRAAIREKYITVAAA